MGCLALAFPCARGLLLAQPIRQPVPGEGRHLISLNATQAAIKAGYSTATAESQASRLLRNVKVAAAIHQERTERAERLRMDADEMFDPPLAVLAVALPASPALARRARSARLIARRASR